MQCFILFYLTIKKQEYHRDYASRLVASFDHKIQSEYYGRNRSVTIVGIVL